MKTLAALLAKTDAWDWCAFAGAAGVLAGVALWSLAAALVLGGGGLAAVGYLGGKKGAG